MLRENLLVIGSGFSFHNMMEFFRNESDTADPQNDGFQDWLIDVCTGNLSRTEREQRLVAWQQAHHARYCHPGEEHLLPLHVCLGMAAKPAEKIFADSIFYKRAVAFLW